MFALSRMQLDFAGHPSALAFRCPTLRGRDEIQREKGRGLAGDAQPAGKETSGRPIPVLLCCYQGILSLSQRVSLTDIRDRGIDSQESFNRLVCDDDALLACETRREY